MSKIFAETVTVIIQARMGSSRLPGKTMAEIEGQPMLKHLIDRVRASQSVREIILATTVEKSDDLLVDFAKQQGLQIYRGSENDVLDRIYQAARQVGARHIVRVTPDCPLLDPKLLDQAIDLYRCAGADYVSNTLGRRRFPDGLDVEVFSFKALRTAWEEARRPSDREHVTAYIRRNPQRFRIRYVEATADFSKFKWSVDTQADLDFVRAVYQRLNRNGKPFALEEILELLKQEPQLSQINQGSKMNEGYYRSLTEDSPIPAQSQSLEASFALSQQVEQLIPGGAQTFSKGPTQFVQGVAPGFLIRGEGSHVWDLDGNEYIDPSMALGSVLLGYGDPDVNESVQKQLAQGVNFSLPHPLELEVAELLAALIPCAKSVRFGKNGSDATAGAIRLARAITNREVIACCGYHGWQDWYIGTTSRHLGVPKAVRDLTVPFEYNNLESLKRIFDQYRNRVAAVILEPVGLVEPEAGFLETVREWTQREGAVLIFDEVLTGFRFHLGGAQTYFNIQPDLACFGKGIANGFPLSAVVGGQKLLKRFEEVFFSFTFGGETLSLAAASATLRKMQRIDAVSHIWAQGEKLKDGFNALARHYSLESVAICEGLPPRTVVQFKGKDDPDALRSKSLFQQECLKRGVLFTGSHLPSFGHQDADVDQIIRVYRTAMEILAKAIQQGTVDQQLMGNPVQPVMRLNESSFRGEDPDAF